MGDGKPTRSDRGAAPRVVASRRTTRFASRATSRSFNMERPPIVLDIGTSILRVGYADQFKPQHIIPFAPVESGKSYGESQWYSFLSPLIDQLYDRLMINPTTRRIVCVHAHCPSKAWEVALRQIFWNRGVPALSFVSSLEMVPVAQGWKRGLIVQVGREETACVAHVDGHLLEYTFQMVPCGYKYVVSEEMKIDDCTWTSKMDRLFLDELNPNGLVMALVKSLESCPRDVRLDVVSNLVFCGDSPVLIPDLDRRVGGRLKSLLEGTIAPLETTPTDTTTADDATEEDPAPGLTVVPIRPTSLKPLSGRIGVTSCAPYSPDVVSWVGASLWAATWYKYEDDETRIKWIFAPTE